MGKFFKTINLKELFFPVFYDVKNINEETDTKIATINGLDFESENSDYDKIISKIEENRRDSKLNHNIVIIK